MENRINIAELLRECPEGMELDCTMFEKPIKYKGLTEGEPYIINIETPCGGDFYLTKEGYLYDLPDSKSIIFPKGKTTWEGFVPPCKFKDGDILFVEATYNWILIYKENENKEDLYKYVATPVHPNHTYIVYDDNPLCYKKDISKIRFATKEEKTKLFDVIKANGYKWNDETKILVKLVEPKFKVEDKVRHKNNHNIIFTITSIEEDAYLHNSKMIFYFDDQDNYELVPNKFDINTLKPLEPVLVRNTNGQVWTMDFFSHIIDTNKGLKPSIVCVGHCPNQCIPYKYNEFLRGTTDDCIDFYKTW